MTMPIPNLLPRIAFPSHRPLEGHTIGLLCLDALQALVAIALVGLHPLSSCLLFLQLCAVELLIVRAPSVKALITFFQMLIPT